MAASRRARHKKKHHLKDNAFKIEVMVAFAVVFALVGGLVWHGSRAASLHCVDQTFSEGSSGQCVKDIQSMLNYKIYYTASSSYIPMDGAFSSITKSRVSTFQNDVKHGKHYPQGAEIQNWQYLHAINVTGTVNPQTWAQLCLPTGTDNTNEAKISANQLYNKAAKEAGCE